MAAVSVRALALWAGLVVAGCGSTTEIVLVVDSDLPPSRVATFWIRVSGAGARCFSVPASEAELPLTLGLVPSAGEQEIEVTAAAFPSGVAVPACETRASVEGAVVLQRARARFVTGERRVLFMTLEADCSGQLCGEDTSCREGRCQGVDRALDPWTGQLPRISIRDAGTMDAAVDGGADAAIVDAGMDSSVDAGSDAGRDAGTDAGDAGPCDGEVRTVRVTPVADTQLSPAGCLASECGGSINYGASEHLYIGQSRAVLRYPLPADLATDLGRLVSAHVRISRLRGHPDCSACAFEGNVEARPMRNDWIEGVMAPYSGADWCRRAPRPDISAACPTWGLPGADQEDTDVARPAFSIRVPETLDDVDLPMRREDVALFAMDGQISVQLRGARIGGEAAVVFLVPSTEGEAAAWGSAPILVLRYCPP